MSVGWWASQPTWTPLTRVADADTRGAVLDKLSMAGVHWRLGEDGVLTEVSLVGRGTGRDSPGC